MRLVFLNFHFHVGNVKPWKDYHTGAVCLYFTWASCAKGGASLDEEQGFDLELYRSWVCQ